MIDAGLEALVDNAKQGDETAISQILMSDALKRVVYSLGRSLTEEDREDILQQSRLKAFIGLPKFEGRSSLRTWLYRIAVNEFIEYVRKGKRGEPIENHPHLPAGNHENPESRLIGQELYSAINETLDKLKNRGGFLRKNDSYHWATLFNDYVKGLSPPEEHKATGGNENTIKTRRMRARHQFLKLLKRNPIGNSLLGDFREYLNHPNGSSKINAATVCEAVFAFYLDTQARSQPQNGQYSTLH